MEHHFSIEIAKDYGIEEAIIIHNLFFWICKNAANGKNYYDGSYWTYNSIAGFSKLFPYIQIDKIKRVLSLLIKKGLLKKGNYNDNKMNHTNWYAFTDEGLRYLLAHGYKMQQSNNTKCAERLKQNAQFDKGNLHKSITYKNDEYKKQDNNIIIPTDVGLSSTDDATKVDYEKLKTCFNEELSKQNAIIPKLASVTDKRKHAINARVKEHGKEALLKVIKKAAASAFLNGRNNRSFIASFDWLVKPNNFIKVLEGNYDENINMNYGNNRSDYEREQRARDAVEIVERLFAADDAERQANYDGGL